MEFLLLKNFDTAGRALLQTEADVIIIEAVGNKEFSAAMGCCFLVSVCGRAEAVYSECISDLHNDNL
jgi:hypothetical protein